MKTKFVCLGINISEDLSFFENLTDAHHSSLKLTIRVFSGLNAHVWLSFVHTTLPLSALLLHGGLSSILSVDVGQIGW